MSTPIREIPVLGSVDLSLGKPTQVYFVFAGNVTELQKSSRQVNVILPPGDYMVTGQAEISNAGNEPAACLVSLHLRGIKKSIQVMARPRPGFGEADVPVQLNFAVSISGSILNRTVGMGFGSQYGGIYASNIRITAERLESLTYKKANAVKSMDIQAAAQAASG
jgi:hypothetical protein